MTIDNSIDFTIKSPKFWFTDSAKAGIRIYIWKDKPKFWFTDFAEAGKNNISKRISLDLFNEERNLRPGTN